MFVSNYIRKIDELGRIVVPKEVRNQLKIVENENVLIKEDNNKIIITKYSYLNNYQSLITDICNNITEIYKVGVIVKTLDKIIFDNSQDYQKKRYTENIISNSTIVGNLTICSINDDYSKLPKLISKIIASFIEKI